MLHRSQPPPAEIGVSALTLATVLAEGSAAADDASALQTSATAATARTGGRPMLRETYVTERKL
jgi:hypothetical protein